MMFFLRVAVVVSAFIGSALRVVAADESTQLRGARDDVYMIRIPPSTGRPGAIQTGFRLRGTSGVVTALHGVIGGGSFSAVNDKNEVFTNLTLGNADIENDVAVLISSDQRLRSDGGLMPSPHTVAPRSFLRVLGHPLGINLHLKAVQTGNPALVQLRRLIPPSVSEIFEARQSPSADIRVMDIETPLVPGHSGAPVLDDSGVVGIVNGGLLSGQAAISWAIPIAYLRLQPVGQVRGRLENLARQSATGLFVYEADAPTRSRSKTYLWQASTDHPDSKLTGYVKRRSGEPIAGVEVVAFKYMDRKSPLEASRYASTKTNVDGYYEIPVRPGGYHLILSKPSFETKEAFYLSAFPGAEVGLTDTLEAEPPATRTISYSNRATDPSDPKTAFLSGEVTDCGGSPIVGAFVTATDADDRPGSWNGRTVKTSSRGKFKIVNLPSALYDLAVEAPGYETVYVLGIPTIYSYGVETPVCLNVYRP